MLSENTPVKHPVKGTRTVMLFLRLDGIFDAGDPGNQQIDWQDKEWKQYNADLDWQLEQAIALFP